MPDKKFKVAAVQDAPVFLNKEASIDKAIELIAKAVGEGARLVVFPEAFISAYPDWVWLLPASKKAIISNLYEEFIESAISIPGKSTDKLCRAAKANNIMVAIGVNERNTEASNASVCNTILYIGSDGSILGKHRKLIPTGGERLMWSPGEGKHLVSFKTEIGQLGGLICWENFMPLARMAMYTQGVQIYVAPTWDSSEAWQISMRHIAREGGMYVISCAQAIRMDDIPGKYEFRNLYPEDRKWINKGNSCIVEPSGKFIAGPVTESQEIIYADISLSSIPSNKWMFDVAGHYNRPDVFGFEIKD